MTRQEIPMALLSPHARVPVPVRNGKTRWIPSLADRIREYSARQSNGCRIWIRRVWGQGYPQMTLERKTYKVARLVFFIEHGHWPTVVRHTCDNPKCVEASHLIDGSYSDNARDRVERGRDANSRKTHCPRGHEYTEENTRYNVPHPTTGSVTRTCRTCRREDYHRKKETT